MESPDWERNQRLSPGKSAKSMALFLLPTTLGPQAFQAIRENRDSTFPPLYRNEEA
jgi:hypothetical protein